MPIVTIQMSKGRTAEQKTQIIEGVTAVLVDTLGVDPGWVTVLLHELDRENIGKAGVPLSGTN